MNKKWQRGTVGKESKTEGENERNIGKGNGEDAGGQDVCGCRCDGGRTARARWKGNVCGVAGGRPSYIANPRQPHSITMLSRIQMTVISFGTPYT